MTLFEEFGFDVPDDFEAPDWVEYESHYNHVNDWRTYMTPALKEHWPCMDGKTKATVAAALQDVANQEEWD